MGGELAYKPGAHEVIKRLGRLYEKRAGDQIFATMSVPSRTLREFRAKNRDGFCDYPNPEERIVFWDSLLKERAEVEDDAMPAAYLSEFDQGLYGGLLGGDVRFLCDTETGWISSMVPPFCENWEKFEELRFNENHPWFGRFLHQLDVFVKGSEGKFGISHFILIDSLNFLFELFGATQTYLELFDHPDLVRKAIDFAFEMNVRIQEVFFELAPGFEGGTFSNMAEWIPGRVVSESVDPFHMTSVEIFEAWGREPAERILTRFDGGVLHLHGNGRHLLPAVRSLRGLKAIYLGDDRNFPPAFEDLPQLKSMAGDLPVVVSVDFLRFSRALEKKSLPGGVLYKVQNVPDVDTANRLMDAVRLYRL